MTPTSPPSNRRALVLERQGIHLALLALLLAPVALLAGRPEVAAGSLLGVSAGAWLWIAVATAIAHQTYVWIAWRLELHGGTIQRALPRSGFRWFKAVFAVLGASRFAVVPLAVANAGTLPLPEAFRWGAAALCLALSGYLFYSVLRYFGVDRAAGIDHFDPAARAWPIVREGMFRYTSNGMYVFGFLVLWVPGLALESAGALLAAAFHHAYIWVHYYCTEAPDMARIYGAEPEARVA